MSWPGRIGYAYSTWKTRDLAQYHPTVCSVKKRRFPGKVPRTEGADHVRSFLKARQTV